MLQSECFAGDMRLLPKQGRAGSRRRSCISTILPVSLSPHCVRPITSARRQITNFLRLARSRFSFRHGTTFSFRQEWQSQEPDEINQTHPTTRVPKRLELCLRSGRSLRQLQLQKSKRKWPTRCDEASHIVT